MFFVKSVFSVYLIISTKILFTAEPCNTLFLKTESRYMQIEFEISKILLPYFDSTSSAICSFVREEWLPLSEKFVLMLLVAITLGCLPKYFQFFAYKGEYIHILTVTVSFCQLGPLHILQREDLNIPKPVREVSLFSCPLIALGMTLILSWLIICKSKLAMWLWERCPQK